MAKLLKNKAGWMARPHHHAGDGRSPKRRVLCNGDPVDHVIEANTDQGFYRVAIKDAKGKFMIDRRRGEMITKTVRGKIEVISPLSNANP